MEREVSLVGFHVLACRPNRDHKIVVNFLFVIGCDEEDGGDDCPDFDQVRLGRLAIFDPKVFRAASKSVESSSGDMLSYINYRRLLMACWSWSITNQLY